MLLTDEPATFTGYHKWPSGYEGYDEGTNPGNGWRQPETNGSFEVFWRDADYEYDTSSPGPTGHDQGFYWWPCYPGCLPDGEPNGSFPTAEGAYLDAMGE